MGTKLYVGNLPFELTDDQLRDAFAGIGNVADCRIITDKFSGRSRGFGFVEMGTDEEAKTAIEKLHDSDLGGRKIIVNEARAENKSHGPRGPKPFRKNRSF